MRKGFDLSSLNTKVPDGIGPDGRTLRVLVTDDSKFVIKQLTQILISEQYEICGTANDGEEAITLYKELSPDLVTLDITMPKMDGITALQKIMEYDKNARIVMVSALGKEELVKKALISGAKNFITKPLDRKKVLERLKAVMSK